MKNYLSKSISSLNQNKLNGLLAEIEFRNYLGSLGFADRVSVGGWIARNDGPGIFGHKTVVLFPETIGPGVLYASGRTLPNPSHGLHTICATFHQIGIHGFFCTPVINTENDYSSITWSSVQLGIPTQQGYTTFPNNLTGFNRRLRRYGFLKYHTDVTSIPEQQIPEEFSKEHLRITFQDYFTSELSDIDGILWGQQYTYPIEIKEKTPGDDRKVGEYFGLDVGPFVKLAFYAAKRGNLRSLFIVREIDNVSSRNLVNWWYITFERLAQFASWNPVAGGKNMMGMGSSVIKIPKAEFQTLDAQAIAGL